MKKYSFGMTTFLESGIDQKSGMTSHDIRINQAIEEIVLADQVGLNYYGIGEHHRYDYAASSPEIILSAASKLTKNIHLGSAVTILSSSDPIKIYQNFATLDILSNGRAEIMAGRGSFIESFPLFGYKLEDYNTLFSEKLELLLKIREKTLINWPGGKHTHPLNNIPIYPRAINQPLKVSIAVGGTPASIERAARLGLPIVFAIIGGDPLRFKPLVDLYKRVYLNNGHDPLKMEIGIHSHGMITNSNPEDLIERYFIPHYASFSKIGKERGWPSYTKERYLDEIEYGSLYVGDVDFVYKKILNTIIGLGINRFLLHIPGSYMPHQDVLKTISIYGKEIIPKLKEKLSTKL